MQLTVLSDSGKNKTTEVSDSIFARENNPGLVHEVVTSYMLNGRSGTSAQLSRSEVRGGGIKPWRQKGTGRARAGTIRSPLWRTGGVTFASKNRDYSSKINRKVYRHSIKVILSELARKERLFALEKIVIEPKTSLLVAKLKQLELSSVLFIVDDLDTNLVLASRNIPHVMVVTLADVNPVILLKYKHICIEEAVLSNFEEWLS